MRKRRLFVVTLGYKADKGVEYASAAERGDGLLFFTVASRGGGVVRGVESAYTLAKSHIKTHVTDHGLHPIDFTDFGGAVRSMYKVVEENGRSYDLLVFDLSGGMRVLTLASVIVAQIMGREKDVEVRVEDENREFPARVDAGLLLPCSVMGRRDREILEAIAGEPGVTEGRLAERLELSLKTVKNRLSQLTKERLVTKKGREAGLFLTPWGEITVKMGRGGGRSSRNTSQGRESRGEGRES